MAAQNLKGKKVAILVANNFEQIEMVKPREVLNNAGAQTFLIAPSEGFTIGPLHVVTPAQGEVQAMHHDKLGDKFPVDIPLEQANSDDFDALLLPGGVMNPDQLRILDSAKKFVRAFDESDKPIAVICHGLWTLISAGVISGRTVTSWPTLQDDVRNAGGHWVNNEVVRDHNWVSSRAPIDLPVFNQSMLKLFSEWEQSARKSLDWAA